MIKPQKYPDEIIGEHYEIIQKWLEGYQKSRTGWDTYVLRISSEDRKLLADIFKECRANGFFNPRVVGEKIVWSQIVQSNLSSPEELMSVEEIEEVVDFDDDVPF